MTLTHCFDCPVPMWSVLAHFAILAIVVALAGAMQRRRREPHTTLGTLLAIFTFLWAVMFSRIIPRWGIVDPSRLHGTYPDSVVWLLLCALDALLVIVFIAARRSHAGPAPAAPPPPDSLQDQPRR